MASENINKQALLHEMLPHFETFVETRENYIKALEKTVEILRVENNQYNRNNLAIRNSLDELVAMQRLSNIISIAVSPDQIISTLIDLTKQVIPVEDADIFLLDDKRNTFHPLMTKSSPRLHREAQQQLEAGIIDWVVAEKRTIIIPDLEYMVGNETTQNFVIVPLIIHNRFKGMFMIHTEKAQNEFSNQDIQLLSVLANQAAAGVENWRNYEKLEKANEELKTFQAQMLQSAKLAAIGEVSSGILHEIKNPIQIIMIHLDLVRRGRAKPNWNDLVTNQLKRLKEITKRLTDFSRGVSVDLDIEIVDVNEAIREIIELVKYDFSKDKVAIKELLSDHNPEVEANQNALQQVILNLMINARDAMRERGGEMTISTESDRQSVNIHVKDTGHGIDKNNIKKLFKPFFTTKKVGEGTGLGLSISDNIVKRFGGVISVQSEIGKGSVFTVTLPIRVASKKIIKKEE